MNTFRKRLVMILYVEQISVERHSHFLFWQINTVLRILPIIGPHLLGLLRFQRLICIQSLSKNWTPTRTLYGEI